MVQLINELPDLCQAFLMFLGKAGFSVPAIVILSLLGYYYYAVGEANKHLVSQLKGQLVLEGHDKQFLLNRLDLLIQRVNKRHNNSDRTDNVGSDDVTLQM